MIERLTATFIAKDAKGVQHTVYEMTSFSASAGDLKQVLRRFVDATGQLMHRVSDTAFESESGAQWTIIHD